MNFFRELITSVNARYDHLNGRLMRLLSEADCYGLRGSLGLLQLVC